MSKQRKKRNVLDWIYDGIGILFLSLFALAIAVFLLLMWMADASLTFVDKLRN